MSDAHIATVQSIYEAFGSGDVEFILGCLADDLDFGSEPESTVAVRVPSTGKSGAMDLHHWWRFDDDGKIWFYRGTDDTALTKDLLTA